VLELNLCIKPRKRLVSEKHEALIMTHATHEVWSMDFMHDQLEDDRGFSLFNVIDDLNRGALGIGIDFSLSPERVIRALKQIIAWRGTLLVIRCNNESQDIRARYQCWAKEWGIQLESTQSVKPQQNAYV